MTNERDGRCGRRQAAIQRAQELGLARWLLRAARADAADVVRRLVNAIEATGGVRVIEDNGARVLSPVMAPEWHDLGTLYLAACIAAGDVPHVDDTLDTSGALAVLRSAGWHAEHDCGGVYRWRRDRADGRVLLATDETCGADLSCGPIFVGVYPSADAIAEGDYGAEHDFDDVGAFAFAVATGRL